MPGPWGKAIERLRLAKGWTREKAAERARMTATTFGRIEKGRHTRTEKLQKIADAFDVPIEHVLSLTGEPQASDIDQLLQRKIREGLRDELAHFRSALHDGQQKADASGRDLERLAIERGKLEARLYAAEQKMKTVRPTHKGTDPRKVKA
jgi:transcriptional regulator with XRE-family HTH domain